MISERFVNTCFDVCISMPIEYPRSKEMLSSIYSIFHSYVQATPEEQRPLNSRNKINFIVYLSKFRYKNSEEFSVNKIQEITSNGKYADLHGLLLENEKYKNNEILDKLLTKTIIPKRKGFYLGKNIPNLKIAIEEYENGNYEDLNSLLENFEQIINKTHIGLKELNRIESISKASSLDLFHDNFDSILERFKNQFKNNSIRSGFSVIDESLPFGGFESGRVYLFGGETGVGKSVMLLNILANTVKIKNKEMNSMYNAPSPSGKKEAHLYITAENLIDESLIRYYCAYTGRVHAEVLYEIKNNPNFNLKTDIFQSLNSINSNILFYYVPARIVRLSEIESIVDDVIQNYDLKSIYIDYLDLIRSGNNNTEYRHELGEVTSGFKRMAIMNNVPVVTATQLNRSGYNNSKPSFTSMSESMEKANDTDFLAFLQRTDEEESQFTDASGGLVVGTKVRLSILKNRGGETGTTSTLLLEKRRNGKSAFNYQFQESPSYGVQTAPASSVNAQFTL